MSTNPGLPAGARAWLLLDVDGVLNVDSSNAAAKRNGLLRLRINASQDGWVYTMHLHTWVGAAVARYPLLAPAWCTTWQGDVHAGRVSIAGGSGFRDGLPIVDLDYYVNDPAASKVDGIAEFVGADPFIWIDDDPRHDDLDRLAVMPGPSLFIRTDPTIGIEPAHLERAASWAAGLDPS